MKLNVLVAISAMFICSLGFTSNGVVILSNGQRITGDISIKDYRLKKRVVCNGVKYKTRTLAGLVVGRVHYVPANCGRSISGLLRVEFEGKYIKYYSGMKYEETQTGIQGQSVTSIVEFYVFEKDKNMTCLPKYNHRRTLLRLLNDAPGVYKIISNRKLFQEHYRHDYLRLARDYDTQLKGIDTDDWIMVNLQRLDGGVITVSIKNKEYNYQNEYDAAIPYTNVAGDSINGSVDIRELKRLEIDGDVYERILLEEEDLANNIQNYGLAKVRLKGPMSIYEFCDKKNNLKTVVVNGSRIINSKERSLKKYQMKYLAGDCKESFQFIKEKYKEVYMVDVLAFINDYNSVCSTYISPKKDKDKKNMNMSRQF